MADYKIIYRMDAASAEHPRRWERGCPLLVEAVQISRNVESGEAFLQARLANLTPHLVEQCTLQVKVEYHEEESESLIIRELDADIAAYDQHDIKPVLLGHGDVKDICVRIVSVEGNKSGRWDSAESAQEIPQREPLYLSDIALHERKALLGAAGNNKDLLKYSPIKGDGWWICACGQINVDSERCGACGQELSQLVVLEDEKRLLDSAAMREQGVTKEKLAKAERLSGEASIRSQEEALALYKDIGVFNDSERIIEQCEDKLKQLEAASRKKKKIAGIVSIVLAFALALLTAFLFLVVFPAQEEERKALEYELALSAFEHREYEDAAERFGILGDYRDSKAMAGQAQYLIQLAPFIGAKDIFYGDIYSSNKEYSKSPNGYISSCKLFLNADETCSISIGIPNTSNYWEGNGTWSAETREVYIGGFPYGEEWRMGEITDTKWGNGLSATMAKRLILEVDKSKPDVWIKIDVAS